MDKAAQLMTTLPPDRAARDMAGAIDYLLAHPSVTGDAVGVIGFCMGGMLTLVIAAQQGDKVAAAAPFYGAPLGDSAPDWSGLTATVLGHFAENDDFFPADAIRDLEQELRGLGKDVVFEVVPETGHAFANEENALGTYHEERGEPSRRPRGRVPARTARLSSRPRVVSRSRARCSIAGGISSRPAASSCARWMLIASRGSRSGHASHGPGGIVAGDARAGR